MHKRYSFLGMTLLAALFIGCATDETSGPKKALERADERLFGAIEFENQRHVSVKNDSGGIYIYGYPNQDVIETLLYRTVAAEDEVTAKNHLGDVELKFDKTDEQVSIYTAVTAPPGRLRYTTWYSLDVPNKMVLTIDKIWDDVTVFDMDTALTVIDAWRNVSIVRHNGSAQVNAVRGDIYLEIAIPEGGICAGQTNEGDIVARIPRDTSAKIKLLSHQGNVVVKNLTLKNEVGGTGALEAVLGLGAGEILLETGRGSIELSGF